MSKNEYKPVGEHVKFTKGDYRPYVEPRHLVNSENFQRIVKRQAAKRRRILKEQEAAAKSK